VTNTDEALVQVIEALLAFLAALSAYLMHKYRKEAAYTLKFFAPNTAEEVPVSFIDNKIPPETWKMSEEVKEFAKQGLPPQEQALFEAIVTNAESNHLVKYEINLSDITYYVEYGQIVGSSHKT